MIISTHLTTFCCLVVLKRPLFCCFKVDPRVLLTFNTMPFDWCIKIYIKIHLCCASLPTVVRMSLKQQLFFTVVAIYLKWLCRHCSIIRKSNTSGPNLPFHLCFHISHGCFTSCHNRASSIVLMYIYINNIQLLERMCLEGIDFFFFFTSADSCCLQSVFYDDENADGYVKQHRGGDRKDRNFFIKKKGGGK